MYSPSRAGPDQRNDGTRRGGQEPYAVVAVGGRRSTFCNPVEFSDRSVDPGCVGGSDSRKTQRTGHGGRGRDAGGQKDADRKAASRLDDATRRPGGRISVA